MNHTERMGANNMEIEADTQTKTSKKRGTHKETPLRFGIDAGQSATKARVEGISKGIYIPSIYTTLTDYATNVISEEPPEKGYQYQHVVNDLHMSFTSKNLQGNQTIKCVLGDKLVRDGREADPLSGIGYLDKSNENLYLYTSLSALAAAAIHHFPNQAEIEVYYEGVISLPASNRADIAELFSRAEKRLHGCHSVIWHTPQRGHIEVTIHVGYVKCVPEGAVSIYGQIFAENGTAKNEEYLDTCIQHVDIGDGTTDLAVTDGTRFLSGVSTSIPIGVGNALDDIQTQFNSDFNGVDASPNRTATWQRLMDSSMIRNQEIHKIADPLFNLLAQKIAKALAENLIRIPTCKIVLLHGGGSLILKEVLHKHFANYPAIKDRQIKSLEDPIFANAGGALLYACSPRFTAYKQAAFTKQT